MSTIPGLEVAEIVLVPVASAVPGLEVAEWVPAEDEASGDVFPALRIVEHGWRGGGRGSRRMRGDYWSDWQTDEGAAMDAPTLWHPAGGMHATILMQGTDAAYAFRSGYAYTGDLEPAVQWVYPTVRGQRYRCRLERGRLAEVRAQRAGARRLRSGSVLWYEVEAAAWREAA